jgi:hypothetical protein
MAAILECPEQHLSIIAGSVVRLGRFESIQWMVAYGWYTWGGNRPVCGWYLMQTDAPSTLKPLQATDLDDIYIIEEPVLPPPPPGPGTPITEEEKLRYDNAFITLESYEDLESLQDDDLHDGKLVRINHDEYDNVAYYVWSATGLHWVPVEFPADIIVTPSLATGTKIATITTDNTNHDIYAPTPDSVSVTAELSEGTKIATITVNDTDTDIYAPAGSGGDSDVVYVPITLTKTDPNQEYPDGFISELSFGEIYDLIIEDHKTVILRETKVVEVEDHTNTYITDFPLTDMYTEYIDNNPYTFMYFQHTRVTYELVTTQCGLEQFIHGQDYDIYSGWVAVYRFSAID